MRRALAILALCCPLLAASSAHAVEVTQHSSAEELRVEGGAEANIVTITILAGDRVSVLDTAGVTSSGNCTVVIVTATCQMDAAPRLDVSLGDGPDSLTVVGEAPGGLSTGAGIDVVAIRNGGVDTLVCGAGVDTVEADPDDVVNADCEIVTRDIFTPPGEEEEPPPVEEEPPPGEEEPPPGEEEPPPTEEEDEEPPAEEQPPPGEEEPPPGEESGKPGDKRPVEPSGEGPGRSEDAPGHTGDLPGRGNDESMLVPGRSVAAEAKQGEVKVREPGTTEWTTLDATAPMPVGTIVDARNGMVTLTTASDLAGGTQTADFTGARFRVNQVRGTRMTTELVLVGGDFSGCPRPARTRTATARAAGKRNRTVRRLWGSGHGRFRTRGRDSAATVRGTIWTVEDRCDGTMTKVSRGLVAVKNLRTKKTKLVAAGERHLVRRYGRRSRLSTTR